MNIVKDIYNGQHGLLRALIHVCPTHFEAVTRFNMLTAASSAEEFDLDYYQLDDTLEKLEIDRLNANQSYRDRGNAHTEAHWEFIFFSGGNPLLQLTSADIGGTSAVRTIMHRLLMFHKIDKAYKVKTRNYLEPISEESRKNVLKTEVNYKKALISQAELYVTNPDYIHPIRPQDNPEFRKITIEVHLTPENRFAQNRSIVG